MVWTRQLGQPVHLHADQTSRSISNTTTTTRTKQSKTRAKPSLAYDSRYSWIFQFSILPENLKILRCCKNASHPQVMWWHTRMWCAHLNITDCNNHKTQGRNKFIKATVPAENSELQQHRPYLRNTKENWSLGKRQAVSGSAPLCIPEKIPAHIQAWRRMEWKLLLLW